LVLYAQHNYATLHFYLCVYISFVLLPVLQTCSNHSSFIWLFPFLLATIVERCTYSRPLFTVVNFDRQSRSHWSSFWCAIRVHLSVCERKITSLCVQLLQFVLPWLTQTHRQHFGRLIWIAQPAELQMKLICPAVHHKAQCPVL